MNKTFGLKMRRMPMMCGKRCVKRNHAWINVNAIIESAPPSPTVYHTPHRNSTSTHLFCTDAVCLSCFLIKYKSFRNNVKNNKQNNITNSISIMTNSTKPTLLTAIHHLTGHWPIMVYTIGVVVVYKIGINQLSPMTPRRPDDKLAVGLFLGPNSESTINMMPINVDEPNKSSPPRLELMMPCQSWWKWKLKN